MNYQDLIQKIRLGFPQPVSDSIHDSYLVHSIMRALDQVDALKSQLPILGKATKVDYSEVLDSAWSNHMTSPEHVIKEIISYFPGITNWGHPNTQLNVIPPPTMVSVIAMLLAQLYNPNLVAEETSHRISIAELEVVHLLAQIIGYDVESVAGTFTFGGTGTVLYALKIAIEKVSPGTIYNGVKEDLCILVSDCSHWCSKTGAGWLGIGMTNVISVPTNEHNEMLISELEKNFRAAVSNGKKIAAIVATAGTTDACAIDAIDKIVSLRDKLVQELKLDYIPHVHADAVIGWAWSVFNHYDGEKNPLHFGARTLHALESMQHRIQHLKLADSVGIDFHKTGFAPYTSSLILFKNKQDLNLLVRDKSIMPYLFHFDHYHPGSYTLEASRSAAGTLAALANIKYFGLQGMQALLGYLTEMAQILRENLEAHQSIVVLNKNNYGSNSLFRVYPPYINAEEAYALEYEDESYREQLQQYNDYNRKIAAYLHEQALQGKGPITSLTSCYRKTRYGEPIVAIKSYIMSPFVNAHSAEVIVANVFKAREVLEHAIKEKV